MFDDEDTFASPSGLTPAELGDTLVLALSELSGGQAAVELLRRNGSWLSVLDAAGFVSVGPPSPRNPERTPRAIVRWAAAVEALEFGGVLSSERRDCPPYLLRLAASLAGEVPVLLGSVTWDLDRAQTAEVLAAISHTTQSHVVQYETLLPDGRDSGWSGQLSVPTVFPWPERAAPPRDVQLDLPLYPARVAEEEALAWALAHPRPVVSLPLDPQVVTVLDHLRWATGMRGNGLLLLRDSDPVTGWFTQRGVAEVEDRLGFVLPDLPGHDRWCGTRSDGPLPDRSTPPPMVEPYHEPVQVFYLPAGVGVEDVTWERVAELGVVSLQVEQPTDPRPTRAEDDDRPSTRFLSAPGGYTSVTVQAPGRATVVTLQRFADARTRVAWRRPDLPGTPWFAAMVPLAPTPALELLLGGRVF